jgi:hypothetical protein
MSDASFDGYTYDEEASLWALDRDRSPVWQRYWTF